jgi:hypothetical protein
LSPICQQRRVGQAPPLCGDPYERKRSLEPRGRTYLTEGFPTQQEVRTARAKGPEIRAVFRLAKVGRNEPTGSFGYRFDAQVEVITYVLQNCIGRSPGGPENTGTGAHEARLVRITCGLARSAGAKPRAVRRRAPPQVCFSSDISVGVTVTARKFPARLRRGNVTPRSRLCRSATVTATSCVRLSTDRRHRRAPKRCPEVPPPSAHKPAPSFDTLPVGC